MENQVVFDFDSSFQQDYDEINPIHKKINDLKRILFNLEDCGSMKKLEFNCKICEGEDLPALLEVIKRQVFCGMRYCFDPYCKNESFARQMDLFRQIFNQKILRGWKNLWHFSIGFKSIKLKDFLINFKKILKRFQYVLNNFWRKLKANGINIMALRVLDFSFETDGMVYVHFHFGAVIPWVGISRRDFMLKVKGIERKMNRNMKIKTPFRLDSWGVRSKEAIMCYLAKRSIGLYKHGEGKNLNWSDLRKGKLIEDIKAEKYFGLSSFMNVMEYYDNFYNSRHFACVGDLPQTCIPVDSFVNDYPKFCKVHGKLEISDIRVEVFSVDEPPPDNFL